MMTGYTVLRALVYCLVWCWSLGSSLANLGNGVVYVKPGMFRFVGESLELYCNITDVSVRENSSMLHFERITEKDRIVIPAEYTEILSTKAIRLRLRKVDLNDDGTYICFRETLSGDLRAIGSQAIKIDHKPRKIKDVSCEVYNWEQMTCTWDIGVTFLHPENIKVSLVWTIHGEQQDCPKLTDTSCLWDSKTYIHGEQYLMVVEVATVVDGKEIMKTRSPQFRIHSALFVRPAPVNNLKAAVKNSSCVDLTWQHASLDWQKFFLAEFSIKDEEKWLQILLDQEQENEDYHSTVCYLTPFTNYEFRVAVLPFPVETSEPVVQGFPSQWKTVSATTLEDVPTAAPKICSDCFYEHKCPEGKSHHCVRIYWQSLKENEKNGILTNYNITYISLDTGANHTFLVPVTVSRSLWSADLDLPTSNQSFKITVIPGTSQGFSKKSSTVFLPSAQRKPNPPQSFLVEWDEFDDEFRFYLSWAALNTDSKKGTKYTNVSVVWCCSRGQKTECQSDINWIKLPADQVTYELKPNEEECYYGNFLIGIAAEASHDGHVTSSGISWSSCVYLRNEKPQNSPRNVHQLPGHPINGLTIQWDSFDCMEERSFITEYLVRYCPLYEDNTCMEAEKSMNVSNTANEVTLKNLMADVRYKVSVVAVSSAGLGPSVPFVTQAVKGSPLAEEPEIDRPTGIIVGVLSFLIFLIFVVVLWRYCCYWKKSVSNIENLIQPYVQSSENYSTKPPQDIRNRPLPKTPEDQHFYGSSACMNTHGSKNTKKSHQSECCSEESVTSDSSLLSNLLQISPTSSKSGIKSERRKVSKKRSSSAKFLIDLNSPNKLKGTKIPHSEMPETVSCDRADMKSNNPSIRNTLITNSSHQTNQPSSTALNVFQHSVIGDLTNSVAQSEITDPSDITLSKTNTLALRKHGVDLPVYPLTSKIQTFNPFSPSTQKSHKKIIDLGTGEPGTNSLPNSSHFVSMYQPLPAHFHSGVQKTDNLYIHHSHQAAMDKLSYILPQNKSSDYLENSVTSDSKRHSVPLESVLYFPAPPTSPPPSSPDDVYSTARLPSTPCSISSQQSQYCKCGQGLANLSQTNFCGIPDHSQHGHLLTTGPASYHPTPSINFPTHNKERVAQSTFTLNMYPTHHPSSCMDSWQHQQVRCCNHEEGTDLVEDSHYLSPLAHTFPRNGCKDITTLQLPSPITRPLSGDLLDLPPAYYQDPELGGSNQILTEL